MLQQKGFVQKDWLEPVAVAQVSVPLYWQIDTHMNDESLREGSARLDALSMSGVGLFDILCEWTLVALLASAPRDALHARRTGRGT